DFEPGCLAHGSVFVKRLVDDVPALDATFVTPDYRVNVITQAAKQGFTIDGFALSVFENPAGRLFMPNEGVADDEHVILLAKRNVTVRAKEVIFVRLWVNRSPFQN